VAREAREGLRLEPAAVVVGTMEILVMVDRVGMPPAQLGIMVHLHSRPLVREVAPALAALIIPILPVLVGLVVKDLTLALRHFLVVFQDQDLLPDSQEAQRLRMNRLEAAGVAGVPGQEQVQGSLAVAVVRPVRGAAAAPELQTAQPPVLAVRALTASA
jgi:hypothetical protein